jgi:hypothetical protein
MLKKLNIKLPKSEIRNQNAPFFLKYQKRNRKYEGGINKLEFRIILLFFISFKNFTKKFRV